MNDFTKDELKCLLSVLDGVYIAHHTVSQQALENKIKSMIDNYCEHEEIYTKLGITVCLDCKKVIEGDL
jgi:hypothetical protein